MFAQFASGFVEEMIVEVKKFMVLDNIEKEQNQGRVELPACLVEQFLGDGLGGEPPAMGAVGGHGGKGIDQIENSCAEGDLASLSPIGEAAAVISLAMGEEDFPFHRKKIKKFGDLRSLKWEILEHLAFAVGKLALAGNDIVMEQKADAGQEDSRVLEDANDRTGQAHSLADQLDVGGQPLDVFTAVVAADIPGQQLQRGHCRGLSFGEDAADRDFEGF